MFKRLHHKLFCSFKHDTNQLPVISIATKPIFKFDSLLDFNEITVTKYTCTYIERKCPQCGLILDIQERRNTTIYELKLDLVKQVDLFNYLLTVEDTFTQNEASLIFHELFDFEKMEFRSDWQSCLKKIMNITDIQIELVLNSNRSYTNSVIECIQNMSK